MHPIIKPLGILLMITLLMSGLTSISTNSPGLAPDPTDDSHESTYSEWEDAFVISKDRGITMSRSVGNGGGSAPNINPDDDKVSLRIEKFTNGFDSDSAPGLNLLVGTLVEWTYEVTNTGDLPIQNVVVSDNDSTVDPVYVSGDSNENNVLDSDEVWLYNATGITQEGQYCNIGNVTAYHGNTILYAEDLSHYFGTSETPESSAGLSIVKLTNGEDVSSATELEVPVGSPVTWSYNVSNTGDVVLTDIVVTDDIEGYVGTIGSLGVGESNNSLSLSNTSVAGAYQNNVTASTTYNDVEVNASDISYYFGVNASIGIEKFTDGHDVDAPIGPYLLFGYPVEWTYVIINIGNVNLTVDSVTDDDEGITPVYQGGDVNDDDVLEPGESWVYNASGTVVFDQYSNTGNVTASYKDFFATDEDLSYYFGISNEELKEMLKGKGYWKKSDNWPTGVTSVNIGNVTYTKEEAIAYLKSPVEDKPYIMFGQLLPAKLNVMTGSPYYPHIIDGESVDFIAAADEWMESYPLDGSGSGVEEAWNESGEQLKDVLEMYNNGTLYINHSSTP